jgi:hypothetical protein
MPAKIQTAGWSSGPDRAGNLLEVVVLSTADDMQLAIHAMQMRSRYRRLLER